jgi:bifunctional DNA-binding transcriptional regulator/antitoxin component of YhaV-PrlF toxin-antitoxin module
MDKRPARIISDGRLTVPKEYRERYELEQGDRVWVSVEPIDEDGGWVMPND